MRPLIALLVVTTLIGVTPLMARHNPRRNLCEIRHPVTYYHSLGTRPHGRYGGNHFRKFHYRGLSQTRRYRYQRQYPAARLHYRYAPGVKRHQRNYHQPRFCARITF